MNPPATCRLQPRGIPAEGPPVTSDGSRLPVFGTPHGSAGTGRVGPEPPSILGSLPDAPLRDLPLIKRSTAALRWAARSAVSRQGRIALTRRVGFELARQLSPIVAVDSGGIRYYVSTSDRAIGAGAFSEGACDQHLMAYALQLLETTIGRPALKGRTFIDIGANIGTATIPAVKLYEADRAIAFEPAPETFKLLRCNIIANDLESKVATMNVGLSDVGGRALLQLCPTNWGDHRVATSAEVQDDGGYSEAGRSTVGIQLERFDDLADEVGFNGDGSGVVWIDTQGHEAHVLAGASSILKSDLPVVVEYWPYGLRRAEGLSLLHELIAVHYRTVIDLRASMRTGKPISQPAGEIAELENRYQGTSFTDLVLLK